MGIKDKGRFMMGIRNRFIYFAGRAAAGVCAALGIWWSCAMTSFADEAIKSVTIAVTSSVVPPTRIYGGPSMCHPRKATQSAVSPLLPN